MHGINKILIMLGTNDCKAVFADSLKRVPQNMKSLLQMIKTHPVYRKYQPEIYVISPPPVAVDAKPAEKYKGGRKRITWLVKQLQIVAEEEECHFVDTYSSLSPVWDNVSADGIHLNSNGHKIVADIVNMAVWK
jgi:lysophospholipase L1-like esterase